MSSQDGEAPSVEEVLGRVPLFSRLGARDLKKLARLCVPRTLAAGDTVIEEGAVGLGMFVLTAGRVEVWKGAGEDKMVLGTMERGDVLGEISLIDDQPRSASAVALTSTECLLLTKDSFDLLVRKEPEIAWCIVPSLAERVRELHGKALKAEEKVRALELASRPRAGGDRSDGRGSSEEVSEATSSTDDAPSADTGDGRGSEPASRALRLQYGLMAGGVKALGEMAGLAEEFMTSLADEADLAESDSVAEIAEKLPEGLVSAVRATLKKMEDAPQEVLDSFRRYAEDERD